MSSIAIWLLLLLAAAAVTLIICVLIYNRRLDRVARGEARDTHSAIPEPSTSAGVIYRIVLMVLAVITLLSVSGLSGTLMSMQSNLQSLQATQNQLNRELEELRTQLEEQDRRVKGVDYQILDPDYTNRTARVQYTVRLQQYAEDTAVPLHLNGGEISLEPVSGGSYSGSFTTNFFEDYAGAALSIREDGKTFMEEAEFPDYIFWDLLPMPGIESELGTGTKFGKMQYEGSYGLIFDDLSQIESVTVTYLSGGKDLKTLDITQKTLQQERIELEQGLDVDRDLSFRFEITTKNGFCIVQQIVMIYETPIDPECIDFLRILDRNGNLLWEDGNY